ncbi:MAG: tetratricopeptide repeat protein [Elusimicrobiota bacterium]
MRALTWTLGACLLAAPAYPFDQIQFLDPLPLEGEGRPVALAAARDRIYVVDDKKSALHILGRDGKLIKVISEKGLLSGPRGVALGPDGEVLVADTGNDRIQAFDADGKFLRTIGSKGSDPGQLKAPRSVAAGADGRVYVADTGNDRIQVFTREGIFLFGFGKPGKENGQFDAPTRILVDVSDHMFVLDSGNERVQVFGPQTQLRKDFTSHGEDMAADEFGFIYMLDRGRGKVNELNPEGFVLGGFGTTGKGPTEFRKAEGIAVGPLGEILVVDSGAKRIKRIRLANKLKLSRPSPGLATKLLVSGPTRTLKVDASALASEGDTLYAYIPKPGHFSAFGPDDKELFVFGRKGVKDPSATEGSQGLAVSPTLGVYAADTEGDRIQVFDPKGAHKANFAEATGLLESRSKEGRVREPKGMAISDKGMVFVADAGNRRVQIFNPDGTFISGFGPLLGPYEFRDPVALAFDAEGFVFVLDRGLRKVFKCEPSGGYIKSWGDEGEGVGHFADPVSMAYDGRSYLYVLDRGLKRVSVFDRDGKWVTNFFSGGTGERNLSEPTALAVIDDKLFIADRGRVVAFSLHPMLAPPLEISTKAAEGEVVLSWDALKDPWVLRYRVQRSSDALGAYEEVGQSPKPEFKDPKMEAYKTYFYRVIVEATTGDQGPVSRPVEVFVPGAFNQAPVEISTVTLGNIFSSNYKWYKDHPLGKAVVVNNLNLPFEKIKLSFRLKDYTDFAAERTIERLDPLGKEEVPLVATLNNKILDVTEDTPIQAEITLTYFEKGEKKDVSVALPLKVYSRNAITWEDPQRIANYVTPKDTPVLDLARDILRDPPKGTEGTEYLDKSLVIAMRLWAGLSSMGVRFVPSPNNPFETVSEDPAFPVDYTQFPRETLRRKSGECDDLATMLASMLEGAAVRSALLDYPGHIALMFDTGESDPIEVGLPPESLVEYGGTLWIPLEPTMLGSPFESASRKAAAAYKEMSAQGKAGVIDLRSAWKGFEPATLPPSDQETLKPDAADYAKRFDGSSADALKARFAFLTGTFKKTLAEAPEDIQALNHLGMVYAQHGEPEEAEAQFDLALSIDGSDAGTLNNLGNLAYMRNYYEDARSSYEKAAEKDPDDAGVWMNLVRTALKLMERSQAEEYGKKALAIDPSLKGAIDALMKTAEQ